jgi:hypothetical protein
VLRATSRRWKTWAATGAGALCLALSLPMAVLAAGQVAPATSSTGSGNPNHEDVWVDNVGQPPGPGHEMDPHLACEDINLWGTTMADATGQFTIDGWAPSGSGSGDLGHPGYKEDQAWPGTKANPSMATWNYNQTQGGDQVMAVITVKTLIADAIANGDSPVNGQGFHFKLQFLQDPQKHKTFWVNCPGPTPTPTPSSSSTPTPTPSSSSTPTPTPSSSSTPTPTPSSSSTPTPTPSSSSTPTPTPSSSSTPTPTPSSSSTPTPTPSGNQPTLTVVKSNDADGDGTYKQTEEAPSPGASVPFKVVITNTSQVTETITAITDSYAGTTVNECQSLVGSQLASGSSVDCTFTIPNYAPAAGASLTDTVTVTVTSDGTSVQADGTSTVTTASAGGGVLGASTGTPGTGAGLEIGLTVALVLLGLSLLGLGRWERRRAIG